MSLSETWGTDADERQLSFPCDWLISRPDKALYRGITINATPEIIFRWLCQMRVAPYSYDWLDNFGKQSPQELTPGLEHLEIGQVVMTIFTLTDFSRSKHLTLRLKPSRNTTDIFGDIAISYVILTRSDVAPGGRSFVSSTDSCRLLVKIVVKYPQTIRGRLMRSFLSWGDLIMMRRQLLNFKRLCQT